MKLNQFPRFYRCEFEVEVDKKEELTVSIFFKSESKEKLSGGLGSDIDSCRVLIGYRAIACKSHECETSQAAQTVMPAAPPTGLFQQGQSLGDNEEFEENVGEVHYLEINRHFRLD